jgi:hypothetical protein
VKEEEEEEELTTQGLVVYGKSWERGCPRTKTAPMPGWEVAQYVNLDETYD